MKFDRSKIFVWLMLVVISLSTFGLVHVQHFCKMAQQHSTQNISSVPCDNKESKSCCCDTPLPTNKKKDNCCDNKLSFIQLHYQAIVINAHFHLQPYTLYFRQHVYFGLNLFRNETESSGLVFLQPNITSSENARAYLCIWNT